MQVNFLGTVKVTKALLPLLRKARGRVINLSNISGNRSLKEFKKTLFKLLYGCTVCTCTVYYTILREYYQSSSVSFSLDCFFAKKFGQMSEFRRNLSVISKFIVVIFVLANAILAHEFKIFFPSF